MVKGKGKRENQWNQQMAGGIRTTCEFFQTANKCVYARMCVCLLSVLFVILMKGSSQARQKREKNRDRERERLKREVEQQQHLLVSQR